MSEAEYKLTPSESVGVKRAETEVLEVEATYGADGSPPPKHFHPAQDERFTVLEGRLTAKVDGVEQELGVGDVLEIPRGVVHQMWNAAPEPARVTWETRPAGRTEDWFREVDVLQREAGDGRPSPLSFGVLLDEYDDTFRLAVGPKPVMGPLTKLLGALGRLTRR
jgi:quercetin dioxygenase-like cupin family protein